MSLRFKCKECEEDIIVSYLKPGEIAQCKSCGVENVVPHGAEDVEFVSPGRPAVTSIGEGESRKITAEISGEFSGVSAWNPKGIGWLGFFFTFLPAGVLLALNWERFGRPERKRTTLILVSTAFVAYVLLSIFTPDTRAFTKLIGLVNSGICYYMYRSQRELFKEFLNKGGEKASFLKPVFNSLIFLVALTAVIIGLSSMELSGLDERYSEAIGHIEEGDYGAAKPILIELYETDYYVYEAALLLSAISEEEGDIVSAQAYLAENVDSYDAPVEMKDFFTQLVEQYGWKGDDGKVTLWYGNGRKKADLNYVAGHLNGLAREWYSDGREKSVIGYSHGVENGQVKFWHPNGVVMAQGFYANGKRHGLFSEWDEMGVLISELRFKHGVLVDSVDSLPPLIQ